MALLKVIFRHTSIFLTSVISIGYGVAMILANWRKIARADLVIIHGTGGFGYTITTPDLARRDRVGQRIVILFAYVPGTHNLEIRKIWPDVDLIFVPIAFRKPFARQFHPYDKDAQLVVLLPYSDEWRYSLFRWIGVCLRWLVSPRRVISDEEYLASFPDHDVPAGRSYIDHWVPAYLRLLRDVPATPLRLPEEDRRSVANALQRAAGKKAKLCCLYLRLRATKRHPDAFLRSGGDVASYCRAVKRLNERGYQVLLVGDRNLPPGLSAEFCGMFVDAQSLNVSDDICYLYAATECDISIGECGGGFWLSPINDVPSMLVNTYPFHIGWNDMVIYYKVLQKNDGCIVPAGEMFGKYGEDIVHTDPKVLENGAAELEAAIAHFADSVERGSGYGVLAKNVPGMKAHYWSVVGESYVSPIWMELYGSDLPIRAEERAARAEALLLQRSNGWEPERPGAEVIHMAVDT
jgi:putative glycosyltransferase (TIGR04372 family)